MLKKPSTKKHTNAPQAVPASIGAPNAVTRRIKVRDLINMIHPVAQRRLSRTRVEQLAAEFDIRKIGILTAVDYVIDGRAGPWVVDGQHRVWLLAEVGLLDYLVEVEIRLDAKTHQEACALFLGLNNRAPIHPYDTYENELVAEFPAAVGLATVAAKKGLTVSRSAADGALCAVVALKNVFKLDNGATLELALDSAISAWGRQQAALEGKLLEGIALLINRNWKKIHPAALVAVLSRYKGGPGHLLVTARALAELHSTTLTRAVAAAVLDAYNRRRTKGKLPPL